MKPKRIRDILLIAWMLILIAAMYAREAYEWIYLLKYGVESPYENIIAFTILSALIISLIIFALLSRKDVSKPKENQTISWSNFLITFLIISIDDVLAARAKHMIDAAYNTVGTINVDKVSNDIILLYVAGYVFFLLIGALSTYMEKRKQK